jgi:hypothetical protein
MSIFYKKNSYIIEQHNITLLFSFLSLGLFLLLFLDYSIFFFKDKISILASYVLFYFFFFIEKKYKNIFLEVLNIFFLFFFIFRASTIEYFHLYNFSFIKEYKLISIDFYKYILILNLQYLLLATSILLIRPQFKNFSIVLKNEFFFKIIIYFLIFFLFSLTVYYKIFPVFQEHDNLRILKIFFYIFNFDKIMIISIFLLFYSELHLIKKYKYILIFIIFCSITSPLLLSGTKSSLLEFALYSFLFFQFKKKKNYNLKYINFFLIFLILSLILFSFAKILKTHYLNIQLNISDGDLVRIYDSINLYSYIWAFIYRISFFDYFFLFVQDSAYENVINLKYILSALADRLTPFYDFFNVPLLSRAVYDLKSGVNPLVNSSMQITLFAEGYVLLKNYAFFFYLLIILIFYIILLFLKKIKVKSFENIIINFFILKNYFYCLVGYGFDTFVMNLAYDLTFLFIVFFIMRHLKNINFK